MNKNFKSGFTLIEVLLVVAIIAIIAGIVILAVNPRRQIDESNDARRRADVNTILNAIYQYAIDNGGRIPTTITTAQTEICLTGTGVASATCGAFIDLESLTNDERYIVAIPVDPGGATTTFGTGYHINRTSNNRIIVRSVATSTTGEYISASR